MTALSNRHASLRGMRIVDAVDNQLTGTSPVATAASGDAGMTFFTGNLSLEYVFTQITWQQQAPFDTASRLKFSGRAVLRWRFQIGCRAISGLVGIII